MTGRPSAHCLRHRQRDRRLDAACLALEPDDGVGPDVAAGHDPDGAETDRHPGRVVEGDPAGGRAAPGVDAPELRRGGGRTGDDRQVAPARLGTRIESPSIAKPEALAHRSRRPFRAASGRGSQGRTARGGCARRPNPCRGRAGRGRDGQVGRPDLRPREGDPARSERFGSPPAAEPRSVRVTASVAAAARRTMPVSDQAQAPPASAASSFAHGTASISMDRTTSAAVGNSLLVITLGKAAAGDVADGDASGAAAAVGGDGPVSSPRSALSPHGLATATASATTSSDRGHHPAPARVLPIRLAHRPCPASSDRSSEQRLSERRAAVRPRA